MQPEFWLHRTLGWAITFVAVVLLVHWGWDLIRPMLPIILSIGAAVVIGRLIVRKYRRF